MLPPEPWAGPQGLPDLRPDIEGEMVIGRLGERADIDVLTPCHSDGSPQADSAWPEAAATGTRQNPLRRADSLQ